MPKIIIQAGHQGRTSGATGAPGEQSFNTDISDRVAEKLRSKGFEVKRVSADPSNAQISGDWDLFLTIHYDADVYNDHGGFVDFPEPSTDGATQRSQELARALSDVYFQRTGIKNVPGRSNKNTRFYYMWKRLSAKTPCVIIECGVGARKPKDNDPLNTNRDLVASAIADGILKGFGIQGGGSMPGELPQNFPDIVHGSTQWDKTTETYMPNSEPKSATFEDLQRVVNGYKGTATSEKNRADKLAIDLAKANSEVEQQRDKVANIEAKCQRDIELKNAEIKVLKDTRPNTEQLEKQYQGIISDLEGQLRESQKQGGIKSNRIAELEAQLANSDNSTQTLSGLEKFIKWLKQVWSNS